MALRSLIRRPGFTATAVLTLALAAGANAVILAAVYGILLKPLPYGDPDRLAAVWPGRFQSNADLIYLREHAAMLSSVAAIAPGWTMSLTGAGEPAKLTVARVSGNLFDTLGVRPLFGRALHESDARKGADSVVLLTHGLWLRQFAGDPSIVGRTIHLEGDPFEVVGVMAPEFEVLGLRTDAFTPFALDSSAWYHQLSFSLLVARLAPGRSLEQASRDYRALIPQIRQARGYPADYGATARLQDMRSATVGDIRSSLVVLGAAVMLILLIAGANMGTLLLTRAAARSREIAVRSAIGASRARIARELLFEGSLVALAGGAVGTLSAWIAMPALVAFLPRDTPRTGEVAVDWTVALFVLAAASVTGLLFGLGPALASLRVKTAALLRAGTHSESRQTKRARGLLVAGEIAVALVLTIAAGLMLQTFWSLQGVDPGFNADRVLTLHLQPPDVGARQQRTTAGYYSLVVEKLRSIPGVASVGAIQHLPFSGYSWTAALDIQGVDVPPNTSRPTAGLRIVTPGYFRSIGQPVIAGREFVRPDSRRGDTVIVNEALAAKYFDGAATAIGRRLRIRGGGIQGEWMSVVGVVGDVRHSSLTADAAAEVYTSITDTSIPAMMIAIRAEVAPLSLVPAVREAIRSIDRNTPISDVQPMEAKVGQSLARPRVLVLVLTGFAAVGLVLAIVGVYAVVAYSVTRRRREIGIMLALGAERGRVMGLVMREGIAFAALGLAVGLPAAFLASRLLTSVLFGVRPTDPTTYASLAVLMLAVVAVGCSVPAMRAASVDPLAAIRSE
jgi:putative ABC transport system permease protein